jgi:hypothetical protein
MHKYTNSPKHKKIFTGVDERLIRTKENRDDDNYYSFTPHKHHQLPTTPMSPQYQSLNLFYYVHYIQQIVKFCLAEA